MAPRTPEPMPSNSGSTSASVPLLSDVEDLARDEDEKTAEIPKAEKKSFVAAEHKIAFCHFLVSRS